jgi:hypothetical protein
MTRKRSLTRGGEARAAPPSSMIVTAQEGGGEGGGTAMAIVDDRFLLLDAPSGAACGSDLAVKIQGHGRTPAESLSPNARSGFPYARLSETLAQEGGGRGTSSKPLEPWGAGADRIPLPARQPWPITVETSAVSKQMPLAVPLTQWVWLARCHRKPVQHTGELRLV